MKVRYGFVTNSSSSSFIVMLNNNPTLDEILFQFFNNNEEKKEMANTILNIIKKVSFEEASDLLFYGWIEDFEELTFNEYYKNYSNLSKEEREEKRKKYEDKKYEYIQQRIKKLQLRHPNKELYLLKVGSDYGTEDIEYNAFDLIDYVYANFH